MSADDRLDRQLAAWMSDVASEAPPAGRLEAIIEATARRRPRSRWLAMIGSGQAGTGRLGWPVPVLRRDLVIALAAAFLIAAAIAGAVLVGGQVLRTDPRPWPEGALVYSVDGDIYVAGADGGSPVRIADGIETDGLQTDAPWYSDPHWSPDGRFLVYNEQSAEGETVHVIDAEGRPVVSLPGFYPMWHPNSSRIAVQRGRVIDVYGLDGALQATLPNPGDPAPLVWVPDGSAVVLPVTGVPMMLPIDGAPPRPVDPRRRGYLPGFSPDGSMVAVDTEDGLYLMAADGTTPSLLSKPVDGTYYGPVWSPSGDRIAVIWSRAERHASPVVIDVATGVVTRLDLAFDPTRAVLGWSSDGRTLLVGASEHEMPGPLWLAAADGSGSSVIVDRAAGAGWRAVAARPLPAIGPLDAGRYAIVKPPGIGSDYRRFTFTLPAGWDTRNGFISKHRGKPGEIALSAWAVDEVYDDPCHWQASTRSPLDLVGHTHDANGVIVTTGGGGLANQAPRGTRPRPLAHVTLGGQAALRVELSVPPTIDVAACDQGEWRSWTDQGPQGANVHHASGQVDVVYMIDVDRSPLVIDASHGPATTAADLAELDGVLRSLIVDR